MSADYKSYHFLDSEGLFYGEQPIAEFNLCVIEKKTVISAANASGRKLYLVEASYTDGREKSRAWVENLKKMDLFQLFEINDCFLSKEARNLLVFKLLYEAGQARNEIVADSHSGLQIIDRHPVYVQGEHVMRSGDDLGSLKIVTHNTMKPVRYTDRKEILNLCGSYIGLLPGVTEILFFGSLSAVVKPFAALLNIPSGLMFSLVAPAGHLKTTLAGIYFLWLAEEERQKTGIYSRQKIDDILGVVHELSGQNFLLDDIHKTSVKNEADRQESRLDIVSRHVSEAKDGANVILTGETMEKVGIFSCIDRIFQIRMPRMDAKRIEELKAGVSSLAPELMPSAAFAFARSLMDSYEEVLHDIQEFYGEHRINKTADGSATRTYRHSVFIRMTEYLFRKYLLTPELMLNKHEEMLDAAIQKQMCMQKEALEKIFSSEETHDYIAELYEIIQAKNQYIRLLGYQKDYDDFENACLLMNGKLYITGASLKNALFNRYQKYIPVNKVVKLLEQEGILETEPSSNGKQKNFKGKKHYVINMRFFISYLCRHGYPVPDATRNKYIREETEDNQMI